MWEWLKHRRRSRRRENRTATVSDSTPPQDSPNFALGNRQTPLLSGLYRPTGESSYPFFVSSRPFSVEPKCLGRLPCSQILYGARVENFSSRCWLENNLHMFGSPTLDSMANNLSGRTNADDNQVDDCFDFLDDEFDTETIESDDYSVPTDFSNDELDSNVSDTDDHFILVPPGESGTDFNLSINLGEIVNPPPYTEFEPPPTYEEAIGSVDRRSTSSRSTSSSLAFMW